MAVVSQQSFNFKVLQYTVAVGASHLLQISLTFLTAIVDIVAKPTYIVWRHTVGLGRVSTIKNIHSVYTSSILKTLL